MTDTIKTVVISKEADADGEPNFPKILPLLPLRDVVLFPNMIIPIMVAYLVSQVIMLIRLVAGGMSQSQQLLLMYSLPLITAWIIFHGPVLALAGKKNLIKLLFHRLPHVLTTTFLGLAGIILVALPLENKCLAASQISPLSPWIVLT